MDITTYIIVVTVISFLIGMVVDYILFRIWHYYAHSDRYLNQHPRRLDKRKKTDKGKELDKQLRKAGYDPEEIYKKLEQEE